MQFANCSSVYVLSTNHKVVRYEKLFRPTDRVSGQGTAVGRVRPIVCSEPTFDGDFSHYVWIITVVCREVSHGQNRQLGAARMVTLSA